jgi:hypothetical protein
VQTQQQKRRRATTSHSTTIRSPQNSTLMWRRVEGPQEVVMKVPTFATNFFSHSLCEIMTQNSIIRIHHRVSPNCRRSSQTSFSDSNRIQLNLTLLLVTGVHKSHQRPAARCRHRQYPGQRGGGKRLVSLGGQVPARVPPVGGGGGGGNGWGTSPTGGGTAWGAGGSAGGQAVQLETLDGAAQIRRHRAVGTCDGYCLRLRRLCTVSMISG